MSAERSGRDYVKATLLLTVCGVTLMLAATFARIVFLNATQPSPLTIAPPCEGKHP